jgi:hypothetical protein
MIDDTRLKQWSRQHQNGMMASVVESPFGHDHYGRRRREAVACDDNDGR